MEHDSVDWEVIDGLYAQHVKIEKFSIRNFEANIKHPWPKGMIKYLTTRDDSLMFINKDKKKMSNDRRWNLVCDDRQAFLTTYEVTSEYFRYFDFCICE
jgi:hypothetical protein